MNIIADVGGQFDALMELIKIMPKEPIVLLGDLNDRGPKSRQVIEFAMNTENVTTLHSNHGHIFGDFVLNVFDPDYKAVYHYETFLQQGGIQTLLSYGAKPDSNPFEVALTVPIAHIHWLMSRPLILETKDLLLTHAPIPPDISLDEALREPIENKTSVIWNRMEPSRRDKFQVFGHNSDWGLSWIKDYAVCLDASRQGVLTGLHWPSKRIYQVLVK